MGIGPLVAWRRASLRALGKTFLVPLVAADRDRRRADRARLRQLVDAGAARVHVLARSSPRRSCSSSCAARRARRAIAGESLAARVRVARRAQPAPLRRLHRPRVDRAARDRHRRLERVPDGARAADCRRGPVDGDRRLHAHVPAACRRARRRTRTATRAVVDVSRGGSHVTTLHPGKNCYPVEQQTSNEVVDLPRPAQRSATCSRSPTRSTRSRRRSFLQGAREAARQPDLARRASSSCSARSSRCGPTRVEQRRLAERYAPGAVPARRDARARARRACSPSLAVAASSRGRSCASRRRSSDRLDEPGELERRRLELVEERDRALAALKELEFDHRTGQDLRRRLPRARRPAAPPRRGDATGARAAGGVARLRAGTRIGRQGGETIPRWLGASCSCSCSQPRLVLARCRRRRPRGRRLGHRRRASTRSSPRSRRSSPPTSSARRAQRRRSAH